MKPHEVFILVILCILALYILLIILDLIFVFSFKSILRKHNKSLAVILNTKYDNIQKMISVIDKYGISIDSPALKEFENILFICPYCGKQRNLTVYRVQN